MQKQQIQAVRTEVEQDIAELKKRAAAKTGLSTSNQGLAELERMMEGINLQYTTMGAESSKQPR